MPIYTSFRRPRSGVRIWRPLIVLLVGGICLFAFKHYITLFSCPQERRTSQEPPALKLGGFPTSLDICPELPEIPYKDPDRIPRSYPLPQTFSRRECTCVPVHNFVILSMQRSGSTWLETLLDSHPSVRTYDEVFEHGVEQYKHNFSRVREMLDTVYRLDWPTNVKGEFIKETCVSAVGFKWMLGQGAVEFESDVLQYFRERKVTVLMLLRRNKVRAFVSKMVAMLSPRTNPEGDGIVWNTKADSEAQALATFRPVMDLEYMRGGLYSALELENEGRRAFNGNSTRFMLLHYEDLLQDPKIMDEVQAFLGVPVRPLSSPFKRIYSGSLRDKIQNFDEIQKGLQGTPFEKFMDLDD
eukprot:jgi/Mesen1/1973/ME000147S01059